MRQEGGGFAAAHLLARRAGYGAAPPASRALRVSCGNGLRPPLTPETSAAPGAGRAGRTGPARARRAARRPVAAGGCRYPDAREQVNWRSITRRRWRKITQIQARAQGPVASSQQSHLAELRHTEPGGLCKTQLLSRIFAGQGLEEGEFCITFQVCMKPGMLHPRT